MKKTTILLFFITAGFVSVAQNSNSVTQKSPAATENIYTSLKPADGQGALFTTREELEAKVEDKKEKIKVLIKENANDPERVKFYREELWRFENAVVQKQ